jgi:predicted short-subunit dehydrogenase-like oxidoreductase (DUF2520 family)
VTAVGIIGPGRAGLGFALALARQGWQVALHGRAPRKDIPRSIQFTHGDSPPWVKHVDTILIAVPDRSVSEVARQLSRIQGLHEGQAVLHLSGVLEHGALGVLSGSGAALGSLHPLVTISDPATAPERFPGALGVIEGQDRAVAAATRIAETVGLIPTPIRPGTKALYHAGAVFGSNYVTVLAATAGRLLESAGIPPEAARNGVRALMVAAVENLRGREARAALTGPVSRGDWETVRQHLAAIAPEDAELYRPLARAAARLAGVDPEV